MVLSHIDLELFGVGILGRLPSRLVRLGVEVVWKILGIGVSHLPVGRKACVGLRVMS